MATENNNTLQTFKTLIVNKVQSAWDDGKTGILLAQLGMELYKEFPNTEELLARRKLAAFLADEMSENVQVLNSPTNRIVRIALPVSVTIEGDVSRFFPKTRNATNLGDLSSIRRAVVAAFSRPLTPGSTRVLKTEPVVGYTDLPVGAPLPAGSKIILPNQIVDVSAENTSLEVQNKLAKSIIDWAMENGVPMERIAPVMSPPNHVGANAGADSLMHKIVAALSENQLRRIELPLDVVSTLLRHR